MTLENLNHPDNSTFNEAQERVLNLMEKDSFKRFLSQTSSRCDNKNYLKSDQQKNLQNEFPKQSALCNLAKNESKTKTVGKQTSKSLFFWRFSSHPEKSFPHPSKFRKRVFTMWMLQRTKFCNLLFLCKTVFIYYCPNYYFSSIFC